MLPINHVIGDYTIVNHVQATCSYIYVTRDRAGEGHVLKGNELCPRGSDYCRDIPQNEENMLQRLNGHPNIVKSKPSVKRNGLTYLVMEYLEQSLDDFFSEGSLLEKTGTYLENIYDMLKYLKEEGIVHRDIKPDNIRLGKGSNLKLVDFGFALDLKDEEAVQKEKNRVRDGMILGTLVYIAPEAFTDESTPAFDMYSSGVTLLEMLYGNIRGDWPLRESRLSLSKTGEKINKKALELLEELSEYQPLPSSLAEILRKSLCPEPEKRLRVEELAQLLEVYKEEIKELPDLPRKSPCEEGLYDSPDLDLEDIHSVPTQPLQDNLLTIEDFDGMTTLPEGLPLSDLTIHNVPTQPLLSEPTLEENIHSVPTQALQRNFQDDTLPEGLRLSDPTLKDDLDMMSTMPIPRPTAKV